MNYENVIQAIGRNRKALLGIFNQMVKKQRITYSVAKNVINEILLKSGLTV